MSRIDDVKQKYSELDISLIDLFSRLDSSGNNKYLGMMCKTVSEVLDIKNHRQLLEIQSVLKELGFNITGLNIKETAVLSALINSVGTDLIKSYNKFIVYNERGLIDNKDVNSYNTVEQIIKEVLSADEKILLKELEKTTKIIYDDENWLVLRPLSYASSIKYGANTKWCTAFKERSYFLKYWKRGILIYFINKKTNIKWAVFKSLDNEPELSWWDVLDKKTEFFDIDFEDYMIPIIKESLKSPQTNSALCSLDIRVMVENECGIGRREDISNVVYSWEGATVDPTAVATAINNVAADIFTSTTAITGRGNWVVGIDPAIYSHPGIDPPIHPDDFFLPEPETDSGPLLIDLPQVTGW
jgi:hypothetical protein